MSDIWNLTHPTAPAEGALDPNDPLYAMKLNRRMMAQKAAPPSAPSAPLPPYVDRPPTPEQAGLLGLSATNVGGIRPEPVEATGHVVPGTTTPPAAPKPPPAKTPPVPATVATVPVPGPTGPGVNDSMAVAGADYRSSPVIKDMIAKVIASQAGAPSPNGFNFADLLKGAGGKLGDFLQRWGNALAGAPGAATQGDIKRQQAFELQKQQAQAEVVARQQALDNTYQMQRMQLQNQMNVANIPIEQKAQLESRLAELDAQYQQEVNLLPMKIQQEFAVRGMSQGADPGAHFVGP